jgi:hypothetical protein
MKNDKNMTVDGRALWLEHTIPATLKLEYSARLFQRFTAFSAFHGF